MYDNLTVQAQFRLVHPQSGHGNTNFLCVKKLGGFIILRSSDLKHACEKKNSQFDTHHTKTSHALILPASAPPVQKKCDACCRHYCLFYFRTQLSSAHQKGNTFGPNFFDFLNLT